MTSPEQHPLLRLAVSGRPTWFSEAVGSKLLHGTERWAKFMPLFLISKGINDPDAHADQYTKKKRQ